jgi:hypothetical protein
MKSDPKRRGAKPKNNGQKQSQNDRVKIRHERYAPKPVIDMSTDMMELQKEIARQQGFDICNICHHRTPLSKPKCIHCDS